MSSSCAGSGQPSGSSVPPAPGRGEVTVGHAYLGNKWVWSLFLGQAVLTAVYFLLLSDGIPMFEPALVLFLPLFIAFSAIVFTRPWFLIVFFAVSATLIGLGFLPGSGGFNVLLVVFLSLVFIVVRLLARLTGEEHNRRHILPRRFSLLFLVFVVAVVFSTLLAWARGFLNIGLISGALTFLLCGSVVCFVPGCLEDERGVSGLIHAIVIAATVSSILWFPAILSAVGKRMTLPFQTIAVGLNGVGSTLGMLVALVMGLLVSEERPSRKSILGVSLAVLTIGLILSKSRGAWVGALVGLAYVLIKTKRVRFLLLSMASISLFVALLEPVKTTFMDRLSQTEAGDPSWLGRLLMWKTAFQIIPRNLLLGIGLHNFGAVKYAYGFPRFLDPLNVSFSYHPGQAFFGHTHNLYIEMLMNLGVFGFVAFLLVVILTILNLNKIASLPQQTRLKGPALGLAALLMAYMTHAMFDYLLWTAYLLFVFAVFLGISLAVIGVSEARLPQNLRIQRHL